MSHRLFVDGLDRDTTNETLRRCFGMFGRVTSAEIVHDAGSGRACRFAYVTFAEECAALDALSWLNGIELDRSTLKVFPADERPTMRARADRWTLQPRARS